MPRYYSQGLLALADYRGGVNAEMALLERQIQRREDALPIADDRSRVADQYVDAARRDSLALARIARRDSVQEQRFALVSARLHAIISDQAAPRTMRDSLKADRALLESKRRLAGCIQARIASLLNPEQAFKKVMSITFAVLIGVVILGFFALALKDEKLRETIFGGEGGIQFLTLFSLVIAIILFGITGILEGKELAALLGGLSGYILGRSTPTQKAGKPGP
jgi:hypothetical protein